MVPAKNGRRMKLWQIVAKIRSAPGGEAVFGLARSLVHATRRAARSDLAPTEQVSRIPYRGATVVMKHRRTKADLSVIRQCFEEDQYDLPWGPQSAILDAAYDQIVAAGRTPLIVDGGANIGASVLRFLQRYPRAHVIAIEPDAENFSYLQYNTAGLDVDLRLAGLAPADGTAYLSRSDDGGWAHRTVDAPVGPSIDMISLPTLLNGKPASQFTPFILKLDIEGAERSLFSGDVSSFDRFTLIVIELHDWMFPGEGTSLGFFRFHAATGREFCVKGENVGSVRLTPLEA